MKGCRPSTSFRLATGRPGSAGVAGGPRVRACRPSSVVVSSASWTYASILYPHQNVVVLLGRPNHRSSWLVGGRRRSRQILAWTDRRDRPPGGREYASAWLARCGRVLPITPLSLRSSRGASPAFPRTLPRRLRGRPFPSLRLLRRGHSLWAPWSRRRGLREEHPPRKKEMGELGELPRHRHPRLAGCVAITALHPLEERLHARTLLHRAVDGLEQYPSEESVRVRPRVLAQVLVGRFVVERKDAGVGRERPPVREARELAPGATAPDQSRAMKRPASPREGRATGSRRSREGCRRAWRRHCP